MFVRIENPVSVVPSVELLRTLGASSSRGQDDHIGQFGSGFPYSLALLARKGLLNSLKICLGKDVFTFSTKTSSHQTSTGGDFCIEEIMLKKQNGATTNLNISTAFGEIDWVDLGMALREFVSNAIDGTISEGRGMDSVRIERVEDNQCRSKEGTVRIYIKIDNDVSEYLDNLERTFLCLGKGYNPSKRVLINSDEGKAKFYRKGVLVGMFGKASLFHYNSNDISLKESRNVDSYAAKEAAAKLIRDSDKSVVKRFLESFDKGEYWEHSLDSFEFTPRYSNDPDRVERIWGEAYREVFGNAVVCENETTANIVRTKGHEAIVPRELLGAVLKRFPIKTSKDILSKDELDGRNVSDATQDVIDCLDRVWSILEKHKLTNGREKPKAHCFSEVTKAEGTKLGYYRDNKVYILTDIASHSFMLTQTMIEEIAHYVTGAMDCTRDFQDFAFRFAALMIH